MTTKTKTEPTYWIYGQPLETKSYESNDDGTLTITGVASTTNKDYANEIVSPEVLESLAKQAPGLNLFLDHNRHYDGGIGAVVEAWIKDNNLWIKAVILKEYASGIKERLDIGMNFGFSISGFPRKQHTPEGILITEYDLKEITLTYIPMNWDTYGTVEYKSQNIVTSNCLTGACYHAIMNEDENMTNEEKNNITEVPEEPVDDEKSIAGLSDEQVSAITELFKNMMNEFAAEFEPRILENLESKLDGMAESAAGKAAEDVANRIVAELKATQEAEEIQESDVEEKEIPTKDEEDETSDVVETVEEDVNSEAGISEPTNEDELEGENKSGTDSETDEDEEEKDEVIDEKSLDQKIHDEVVKQLNKKNMGSKYDQFRKENTHHKKMDEKSMKYKPVKRDNYGRNLDYV